MMAFAPSNRRSRWRSRKAGWPARTRSPSHTPSPRTKPASKTDTTARSRGTSSPLTQMRMRSLRASSSKSCVPCATVRNLMSAVDVGREVLARERGAGGDEVGWRALEDDPAAVVAGAGAEVDDPVGVRHDRLVVLDDDDRLAGVHEPVEQAEQLLDVGEVQAGGRLVEDIDAALLGHASGQLEPLPLAAGQRSERLAEAEVVEADVGHPGQ